SSVESRAVATPWQPTASARLGLKRLKTRRIATVDNARQPPKPLMAGRGQRLRVRWRASSFSLTGCEADAGWPRRDRATLRPRERGIAAEVHGDAERFEERGLREERAV